jgi:hypothetical protein
MAHFIEECCWWLKSKWSSEEEVQAERALFEFERDVAPELEKGAVFSVTSTMMNSADASSIVSNAISFVTGNKVAKKETHQCLVRLDRPVKKTGGAPKPTTIERMVNAVVQQTTDTALVWSSLELEKNVPKVAGRIPLHTIQKVKEQEGSLVLLDHNGISLFEGSSTEATKWVSMLESARTALAPQIEEEAAATRGMTYHAQRLQRLEQRKKERDEQKKKLGPVPMSKDNFCYNSQTTRLTFKTKAYSVRFSFAGT